MKRAVAAVVAGLLLALPGSAVVAQTKPVTLVVPQTNEPKTLSPDFVADTGGYHPTSNIYSALVMMDWGVVKGVAAYGDLAESWTVSDDGKTYTFKLFPNVKWSDGVPLTSEDVKFTFDRIIEKKYPFALYLKGVKEIRAPDATTVAIELTEPDTSFVPMMGQASNWTGKIYPKHLWEKEPGFDTGPYVNNPVGSGPFMYKNWVKGSHVELAANPDYFRGKSKVDTLIFKTIPDANVARAEFDAHNFPYLPYDYAPPLAEVASLQRDKDIQVVFTPSHYSRDIMLNIRKGPLANVEVRRAIATAIDREAMAKLAFYGYWKPSYYASVDSQEKWIDKNATFPRFDKAKAEKMLDDAGFKKAASGWRFDVSITNPVYSDCKAMMEVLVQQLRDVGINAKWDQYDMATWFTKMGKGEFDISCYFTRYGPDPDAYAEHFGTGGARNFMGYSNPKLDQLAAEARKLNAFDERAKRYQEIQRMLVADMPYINLFNEVKTSLVRAGWQGMPVQESGYGASYTWFGYYGVTPPKT